MAVIIRGRLPQFRETHMVCIWLLHDED